MPVRSEDVERWRRLLEANRSLRELMQEFLRELEHKNGSYDPGTDPAVELVCRSLRDKDDRPDAVTVAQRLPQSYHLALLDDLLKVAVEYVEPKEGGPAARRLITALPKEWLDISFRPAVRRYLEQNGLNSGMLHLCADIDPELARELGERALSSDDEYQSDIGAWVLDYLSTTRT